MKNNRFGFAAFGWLPLAWYIVFLLGPLALVLATSVASRGLYGGIDWQWSLANFTRGFDSLYVGILLRSLGLALFTTLFCLSLGFPMALAMATGPSRLRTLMVFVLAIPFLTNLVIRICALKSLLAFDGPVAGLLRLLSISFDPFALSQNSALVVFGMISTYLPFMVFPLFGALERFDFSLVEAARDLGAREPTVFLRVLLPNLRRAVASGSLLVFIPAVGEFLIPDLLGGAKTMLVGNLISEQFLKARDWPFGSALAVVLIATLGLIIVLITRLERDSREEPL